MKFTAMSDLHGNLIDIEPCDTLLLCGDISPLNIQKDYIQMTKWFFNDFYKWIINLPCDRVIMTPGNHDFWFELFIGTSTMYLWDKLTILIDDETNIYSSDDNRWYKIYATPQCRTFGNWAYMPGNNLLNHYYKNIPEGVDILMSHDAPQIGYIANIMEKRNDIYPNGVPEGNIYLLNAILELEKKPKYILCGHIHSGDHELKEIEGIKCANVSILDESYNLCYKPLTFEL